MIVLLIVSKSFAVSKKILCCFLLGFDGGWREDGGVLCSA